MKIWLFQVAVLIACILPQESCLGHPPRRDESIVTSNGHVRFGMFGDWQGFATGQPPYFKLSIAVPTGYAGRALSHYSTPEADRRTVHFHVLLTNVSGETQRIWEEWNSWGARNLTFELSDASGKSWKVTTAIESWTMNYPSWYSIAAGETHVFDIYYLDAFSWKGFPKGGSPPLTIKARYSVSLTTESFEEEVWVGKVESEPVEVRFYGQE